jgi:hypothetical protein
VKIVNSKISSRNLSSVSAELLIMHGVAPWPCNVDTAVIIITTKDYTYIEESELNYKPARGHRPVHTKASSVAGGIQKEQSVIIYYYITIRKICRVCDFGEEDWEMLNFEYYSSSE